MKYTDDPKRTELMISSNDKNFSEPDRQKRKIGYRDEPVPE